MPVILHENAVDAAQLHLLVVAARFKIVADEEDLFLFYPLRRGIRRERAVFIVLLFHDVERGRTAHKAVIFPERLCDKRIYRAAFFSAGIEVQFVFQFCRRAEQRERDRPR